MTDRTEREHLNWATERAIGYYPDNKREAFASFLSDVTKHPGTAWIAGHPATFMLLEQGWKEGRDKFEKMMAGFAASDQLPAQPQPNPGPANTGLKDGMEQALWGFLAGGSPDDTIAAQESAGQSGLVNSNTLPSRMSVDDRRVLEQAGVVFGDPVPGDDMFVNVNLPEGWRKVATDHSMWSDLVDDQGRKRASIFYKAAFYDRSAHLNINRRFSIGMDYDQSDKGIIVMFVTDGGKTRVFTTKEYPYSGEQYRDEFNAQESAATGEARDWLYEHYPYWEDASAYWD